MTDTNIFKEVIKKAVANGYKHSFIEDWKNITIANEFVLSSTDGIILTSINTVFFDSKFIKAFFKNAQHDCSYCGQEYCTRYNGKILKGWQEHLISVALHDRPIRYLARYLKGDIEEEKGR